MSTGWILFAGFIVIGLVDLGLGFIFSRTPDPEVGAPPPESGENSPQARRFVGRVMMFSALLLWGLAAASAYGLLGPEFALPALTGASAS